MGYRRHKLQIAFLKNIKKENINMIVLGTHADHDAGAAISIDGKIISAISHERIIRTKMAAGVPKETIFEALKCASIKAEDVDMVCIFGQPLIDQLKTCLRQQVNLRKFTGLKGMWGLEYFHKGKMKSVGGVSAFLINTAVLSGLHKWYFYHNKLEAELKKCFPKSEITHIHHHDGHAFGAYYCSGFENCLNVVIEGSDYENCMVLEVFSPTGRNVIARTPWPHSPGSFYQLVTQLLGFNSYTHPGKITGLAAYGNPFTCISEVSKLMWVEGLQTKIHPDVYNWSNKYAYYKANSKKWIPDELKKYSMEDIAAAFQKRFEECIINILTKALKITGQKSIVLSGGCVANVRLNQLIYEIPGVENIFIMPSMSDAGQPIGLALAGFLKKGGKLLPKKINDVFWGPEYSNQEIKKVLDDNLLKYKKMDYIEKEIAQLINEGKVVARFNGRMEFGPRALGNRSILYHCKDKSVNAWLNKQLKRTEFMPFAPAVLAEEAHRCFKNFSGCAYTAEFMTITCNTTDFMKENCPAAVHIDGTARPQCVTKNANLSFYNILQEYYKISGIPCIINTSFNMHEEPIVMTPDDAIRSFKQGHLNYLAIGNFLVQGDIRK